MSLRRACPHCHQEAPIVLRGMEAFCTVCNARRTPFAANALNLAGKPAHIGGYAARAFGWGAMLIGLFLALSLGLVTQAFASMFVASTWIGFAVGIPIALLSVALALIGIIGGRRLGRAGNVQLRSAQVATIHGLAQHQNGVVKASDAARALGLPLEQADALLTALAKEPDENVSIDIDDDGNVLYVFGSNDAVRWRVHAERGDGVEWQATATELDESNRIDERASSRPRTTR